MTSNVIDNLNDLSNDDTIEIFKDLIQNFNLITINKYTLEAYASMETETVTYWDCSYFNGIIYHPNQNNTLHLIRTIFR